MENLQFLTAHEIISLLLTIFILTLPGYIFSCLFSQKPKIWKIPLYFATTMALYSPLYLVAFYYELPTKYVITVIFLTIIVLLVFWAYKKRPLKQFVLPISKIKLNKKLLQTTLITSVFALLAYIALFNIAPIFHGGDSEYHFAHVRNMTSQGKIVNEEAIAILKGTDKISPGYESNSWYATWATLANFNHQSPQRFITNLNPLLFVLTILSVVFLTASLGDNKRIRILAAIIYIITVYLFRPVDAMIAFYPNRIGYLIFLPVITGTFVYYLRAKERDNKNFYLITGVFSMGAAGLLHNMAFLYSFVTCLSFFVVKLLIDKNRKSFFKNNILFFVLAFLAASPVFLIKIKGILSFTGYISSRPIIKGAKYIADGMFFYTVDFGKSFIENGLGIIIGVGSLIYYQYKKINMPDWLILFISTFLAILLIRENPLVAPMATKLFSDTYLRRFFYILPTVVIFTFAYDQFVLRKIGNKIGYSLLAILFGCYVFSGITLSPYTLAQYHRKSDLFKNMGGVTAFINTHIPLKSHVATDLLLGYELAGRSNVRVIAIPKSRTSVYALSDYQQRYKDLLNLFYHYETEDSQSDRTIIIKRYDVEYLLVATNNSYLRFHEPKYDGNKINNILKDEKNLKIIYKDNYYQLYKVDLAK